MARRRQEGGWGVLATFLLVVVVGVALGQMVVTSAYGVLAARRSHEHLDARLAAADLLNRPAPTSTGGSVFPGAPMEGWFDVVAIDAASGRIVPCEPSAAHEGALLRQWRVSEDAAGGQALSVSAVVVDAQLAPVDGPDGAAVILTRSRR